MKQEQKRDDYKLVKVNGYNANRTYMYAQTYPDGKEITIAMNKGLKTNVMSYLADPKDARHAPEGSTVALFNVVKQKDTFYTAGWASTVSKNPDQEKVIVSPVTISPVRKLSGNKTEVIARVVDEAPVAISDAKLIGRAAVKALMDGNNDGLSGNRGFMIRVGTQGSDKAYSEAFKGVSKNHTETVKHWMQEDPNGNQLNRFQSIAKAANAIVKESGGYIEVIAFTDVPVFNFGNSKNDYDLANQKNFRAIVDNQVVSSFSNCAITVNKLQGNSVTKVMPLPGKKIINNVSALVGNQSKATPNEVPFQLPDLNAPKKSTTASIKTTGKYPIKITKFINKASNGGYSNLMLTVESKEKSQELKKRILTSVTPPPKAGANGVTYFVNKSQKQQIESALSDLAGTPAVYTKTGKVKDKDFVFVMGRTYEKAFSTVLEQAKANHNGLVFKGGIYAFPVENKLAVLTDLADILNKSSLLPPEATETKTQSQTQKSKVQQRFSGQRRKSFGEWLDEKFHRSASAIADELESEISAVAQDAGINWKETKHSISWPTLDGTNDFIKRSQVKNLNSGHNGSTTVNASFNSYRSRGNSYNPNGDFTYALSLRFDNLEIDRDNFWSFNSGDFLFKKYQDEVLNQKPTTVKTATKAELEERARKEEQDRITQQAERVADAKVLVNKAFRTFQGLKPLGYVHPQLQVKQLPEMTKLLDLKSLNYFPDPDNKAFAYSVYDIHNRFVGYQYILENKIVIDEEKGKKTNKRFNKGLIKNDVATGAPLGAHRLVGEIDSDNPGNIYYSEGWANAGSNHVVTGDPSVICLDKGNMKNVIGLMMKKYPNHTHIHVADNDKYSSKNGNVGVLAALDNAFNLGCKFTIPTVDKLPNSIKNKYTDTSDIYVQLGKDALLQELSHTLDIQKDEDSYYHLLSLMYEKDSAVLDRIKSFAKIAIEEQGADQATELVKQFLTHREDNYKAQNGNYKSPVAIGDITPTYLESLAKDNAKVHTRTKDESPLPAKSVQTKEVVEQDSKKEESEWPVSIIKSDEKTETGHAIAKLVNTEPKFNDFIGKRLTEMKVKYQFNEADNSFKFLYYYSNIVKSGLCQLTGAPQLYAGKSVKKERDGVVVRGDFSNPIYRQKLEAYANKIGAVFDESEKGFYFDNPNTFIFFKEAQIEYFEAHNPDAKQIEVALKEEQAKKVDEIATLAETFGFSRKVIGQNQVFLMQHNPALGEVHSPILAALYQQSRQALAQNPSFAELNVADKVVQAQRLLRQNILNLETARPELYEQYQADVERAIKIVNDQLGIITEKAAEKPVIIEQEDISPPIEDTPADNAQEETVEEVAQDEPVETEVQPEQAPEPEQVQDEEPEVQATADETITAEEEPETVNAYDQLSIFQTFTEEETIEIDEDTAESVEEADFELKSLEVDGEDTSEIEALESNLDEFDYDSETATRLDSLLEYANIYLENEFTEGEFADAIKQPGSPYYDLEKGFQNELLTADLRLIPNSHIVDNFNMENEVINAATLFIALNEKRIYDRLAMLEVYTTAMLSHAPNMSPKRSNAIYAKRKHLGIQNPYHIDGEYNTQLFKDDLLYLDGFDDITTPRGYFKVRQQQFLAKNQELQKAPISFDYRQGVNIGDAYKRFINPVQINEQEVYAINDVVKGELTTKIISDLDLEKPDDLTLKHENEFEVRTSNDAVLKNTYLGLQSIKNNDSTIYQIYRHNLNDLSSTVRTFSTPIDAVSTLQNWKHQIVPPVETVVEKIDEIVEEVSNSEPEEVVEVAPVNAPAPIEFAADASDYEKLYALAVKCATDQMDYSEFYEALFKPDGMYYTQNPFVNDGGKLEKAKVVKALKPEGFNSPKSLYDSAFNSVHGNNFVDQPIAHTNRLIPDSYDESAQITVQFENLETLLRESGNQLSFEQASKVISQSFSNWLSASNATTPIHPILIENLLASTSDELAQRYSKDALLLLADVHALKGLDKSSPEDIATQVINRKKAMVEIIGLDKESFAELEIDEKFPLLTAIGANIVSNQTHQAQVAYDQISKIEQISSLRLAEYAYINAAISYENETDTLPAFTKRQLAEILSKENQFTSLVENTIGRLEETRLLEQAKSDLDYVKEMTAFERLSLSSVEIPEDALIIGSKKTTFRARGDHKYVMKSGNYSDIKLPAHIPFITAYGDKQFVANDSLPIEQIKKVNIQPVSNSAIIGSLESVKSLFDKTGYIAFSSDAGQYGVITKTKSGFALDISGNDDSGVVQNSTYKHKTLDAALDEALTYFALDGIELQDGYSAELADTFKAGLGQQLKDLLELNEKLNITNDEELAKSLISKGVELQLTSETDISLVESAITLNEEVANMVRHNIINSLLVAKKPINKSFGEYLDNASTLLHGDEINEVSEQTEQEKAQAAAEAVSLLEQMLNEDLGEPEQPTPELSDEEADKLLIEQINKLDQAQEKVEVSKPEPAATAKAIAKELEQEEKPANEKPKSADDNPMVKVVKKALKQLKAKETFIETNPHEVAKGKLAIGVKGNAIEFGYVQESESGELQLVPYALQDKEFINGATYPNVAKSTIYTAEETKVSDELPVYALTIDEYREVVKSNNWKFNDDVTKAIAARTDLDNISFGDLNTLATIMDVKASGIDEDGNSLDINGIANQIKDIIRTQTRMTYIGNLDEELVVQADKEFVMEQLGTTNYDHKWVQEIRDNQVNTVNENLLALSYNQAKNKAGKNNYPVDLVRHPNNVEFPANVSDFEEVFAVDAERFLLAQKSHLLLNTLIERTQSEDKFTRYAAEVLIPQLDRELFQQMIDEEIKELASIQMGNWYLHNDSGSKFKVYAEDIINANNPDVHSEIVIDSDDAVYFLEEGVVQLGQVLVPVYENSRKIEVYIEESDGMRNFYEVDRDLCTNEVDELIEVQNNMVEDFQLNSHYSLELPVEVNALTPDKAGFNYLAAISAKRILDLENKRLFKKLNLPEGYSAERDNGNFIIVNTDEELHNPKFDDIQPYESIDSLKKAIISAKRNKDIKNDQIKSSGPGASAIPSQILSQAMQGTDLESGNGQLPTEDAEEINQPDRVADSSNGEGNASTRDNELSGSSDVQPNNQSRSGTASKNDGLSRSRGIGPKPNVAYTFSEEIKGKLESSLSLADTFDLNIAAISLAKELTAQKREATAEEKDVLALYRGWGGLSRILDPYTYAHSERRQQLDDLVTAEEYESIKRSTLTAFYTSPTITEKIWEGLQHMGLKGGIGIDPAFGTGNFVSSMPTQLKESVTMQGREIDNLTAEIAGHIHGSFVKNTGYEDARLPANYLDFAISNVPFGEYKVFDKQHKDLRKHMIHDYFFLKSLDKVKPGGFVAFVTSSGTMNKKNSDVRQLIHEQADLVGAIRLPNTAFIDNAGTEVNSDIIFLQKRLPGAEPKDDLWVHSNKRQYAVLPHNHIQEELRSNDYFEAHPEMVIGEQFAKTGRFGMEITTKFEGDLGQALEKAIKNLPIDIHFEHVPEKPVFEEVEEVKPQSEVVFDKKLGSYQINSQGNVAITRLETSWDNEKDEIVETLKLEEVSLPKARIERVKGLISLRDTVKDHLQVMLNESTSKMEYATSRDKLNAQYDAFAKKFGPVNNRTNKSQFKADPDSALVLSLEKWNKDSKTATKADIFTERTINPPKKIEKVDDPETAVIISLSERTFVDIPYIEKLTGRDWEDLQIELGSSVFLNPTTDQWEHSSTYLSGNVIEKLNVAKERAEIDEQFSINVEALEAIKPVRIPHYEIKAKLGSSWIPPEYIGDFVKFLTTGEDETCTESQRKDYSIAKVHGLWECSFTEYVQNRNSGRTKNQYGTKDLTTGKLVELILNNKEISVKAKDPDSGKYYVLVENTAEANAKADLIKAEFKQWLWEDSERREKLEEIFNNKVNVFIEPQYDGSKIEINGLSPMLKGKPFAARENQKNAIMRYLIDGRSLFLHDVGVGKSFAQLGAIMKGKEVGKHNKAILAVPNPVFPQMEDLAINHFPSANVLTVDTKKLDKNNREITLNQIATNNWDIIIIPHSVIPKLSVPNEFQLELIDRELDKISESMDAANDKNGFTSRSIKQKQNNLEKARTKLIEELEGKKPYDTVNIEEMGIDALFIDEADEYANLDKITNMSHVAGVAVRDSKKCRALLTLTEYINHKRGNKGVVLSTGTDIRNNMADQYTMMRYLAPDILEDQGIGMFDDYIGVFGEIQTAFEVAPEGTGFIQKTRLNKFVNLPEMLMLYRQVADVVNAEDAGVVRPNIEEVRVLSPNSEELSMFMKYLGERAKRARNGNPIFDNDNLLAIANEGKKAAIDLRMVDKRLPDLPGSKINLCVENVLKEYHANIELNPSQIIFCDQGVPNDDGRFDVYNDMKRKLMAGGMTEDQVVFARDYKSDAQKQELQDKMNSGEIAVSIGSTENMGVGKNVQERLAAIHDVSVPWRVRDLEQRGGRIERFGNIFDDAKRYKYTTEDSFDLFIWNKLRGKALFAAQTKLSPRNAQREFNEDIEPSYAEIMSITTGNTLIKDAIETESKIDQLKLLERTHYRAQSQNAYDIENATRAKVSTIEEIAELDVKIGEVVPAEVKILGRPLGEDPEAAKKINSAIANARKLKTGQTSFQIGEINGFKMGISAPSAAKKQVLFYEVDGDRKQLGAEHNVGTLLKAIPGYIDELPKLKETLNERLEYFEDKIVSLKNASNKPFEQKAELIEAELRLKEINEEMALTEDKSSEVHTDPVEDWDLYLTTLRAQEFNESIGDINEGRNDLDGDFDLPDFDEPELQPL